MKNLFLSHRNKLLYARYCENASIETLTTEFNLTKQRIYQIISRMKEILGE